MEKGVALLAGQCWCRTDCRVGDCFWNTSRLSVSGGTTRRPVGDKQADTALPLGHSGRNEVIIADWNLLLPSTNTTSHVRRRVSYHLTSRDWFVWKMNGSHPGKVRKATLMPRTPDRKVR